VTPCCGAISVPALGGGDDTVVLAGGQGRPGADLVRPGLDFLMVGFGTERQLGLGGGLGRRPGSVQFRFCMTGITEPGATFRR
jgi:hypothetical protein